MTTPLVDEGATIFVYSGRAVRVEVRDFMAYFPNIPPLEQVAPDLWAVTVRLPEGIRFEYKLAVATETSEDLIGDPFNPHLASGSLGTNSVAFGPGYVEPPWAQATEPVDLRRHTIASSAFGTDRDVLWYLPSNAEKRLPVVVVHDGGDFLAHASMAEVSAHLMRTEQVPPAAIAFVDAVDRFAEYTDDARHLAFLDEVLADGASRYGLEVAPSSRVYAGASLGAVAALASAWRGPAVGGLILFSGAFVRALGGPTARGEHYRPVVDFMERFLAAPGRPADRIYQSCGRYEGLIPENRSMSEELAGLGIDAVYHETADGHHFHNWRNTMKQALSHALGGTAAAAEPS